MDYTGRIITKNPQTPSANGAPGVWTLDEAMQYSKQGKWPPGYQISRSVRLRSSASAYFNRTPASASNRTTWTWSAWVKRGKLGAAQVLFSAGTGTAEFRLGFISSDAIEIYEYTSPSYNWQKITTAVYRDPSAWYHIELTYDTTNGTAANRIKLYVNGTQVTSFSTDTNPTSSFSGYVNSAVAHGIGSFSTGANYLDGYLTEINFIDGQALTPASFGYFDTYTGVWQPAPYTGTYGTNGFYLTFADNSAATAAAIGKDYSGNGNNWTPNNISVTNVAAPNTNDSMVDVPINWGQDTGVGGEVRGNYAVLSSVTGYAYASSNGNLTAYGGNTNCYFSMPVIGKMYFEAYCSSLAGGGQMGFVKNASIAANTIGYNQAGYYGVNYASGAVTYWVNGTNDGINHGTISGNTLKFAVDGATGKVWIGSGSTWFGSGDPANGTNPAFTLSLSTGDLIYPMVTSQSSTYTFTINAGQQTFGNAAPSGFKAMCTQNISVPTVLNGASYMAATLYTGTGGTLTISNGANNTIGTTFQPDWVWVKSRSAATDHKLTDSVRGATKALISDTTGAETTDTNGVTAFGTTGFTLGSDTVYNNSGATYVGWQWKASGSTVSNTNGSVTSTVSANTTAGFSIATFTPPASGVFTFGHGLGVAPNMVIFKDRNTSGNWAVYHSSIGPNSAVFLNTTGAISTSSGYFNNTSPTSTVATGNVGGVCTGSSPTVAYSFAAITGFSAFGSYTGNGSTDGPFIYLGFRPRFVLWKRTDSTGSWYIQDTSRSPYNQSTLSLYPNLADAETSGDDMDYLSNGFKVRDTFSYINASGGTYIYAAFAENPFTIARAR